MVRLDRVLLRHRRRARADRGDDRIAIDRETELGLGDRSSRSRWPDHLYHGRPGCCLGRHVCILGFLGVALGLEQGVEWTIAVVDLESVLRDVTGNLLAGLGIRDLEVL